MKAEDKFTCEAKWQKHGLGVSRSSGHFAMCRFCGFSRGNSVLRCRVCPEFAGVRSDTHPIIKVSSAFACDGDVAMIKTKLKQNSNKKYDNNKIIIYQ
jgi:hypothetical protein